SCGPEARKKNESGERELSIFLWPREMMWCPMPVRLRMRKHRRDWIGVRCRIPDRRRLSLDLRWILRLQSRCRDREGPQHRANRRNKLETQTPHLWYPKTFPPGGATPH